MSIAGVKDVYPCDGVTDEFEITFPFGDARDVWAFISNTVTGDYRRLIRNLDYTIEVRDDGNWLRLRNDDFRSPWPTDWNLCIMSRVRIEQGSSQAMSPEVFAKRVNQLIQMFSQLKEQLDRTLHIGQEYPPLNLTSAPYAYIFEHGVNSAGFAPISGYFEPSNFDTINSMGLFMVAGTMREPVITYGDWPTDDIESIGITVLEGTMRQPLVTYSDWPVDGVDSVGLEVLSGTMIAPIVTYVDWPTDDIEGVGFTVTAGTLN